MSDKLESTGQPAALERVGVPTTQESGQGEYVLMICPLLSKSGSEPSECQKDLCAWWIRNECAVVEIASWLSYLQELGG
jgi:hypothetical protein